MFNWFKNIFIFSVLTTVIINILPNSRYERSIKLLLKSIMLIVIILPALKMFKLDEKMLNTIDTLLELQINGEENNKQIMYGDNKELMLNSVKDKVQKDIEKVFDEKGISCESVKVVVDEEDESETYGHVKSVNVKTGNKEVIDNKKNNIEKITIDKVSIGTAADESDISDSDVYKEIKNELAAKYEVSPENIIINTGN